MQDTSARLSLCLSFQCVIASFIFSWMALGAHAIVMRPFSLILGQFKVIKAVKTAVQLNKDEEGEGRERHQNQRIIRLNFTADGIQPKRERSLTKWPCHSGNEEERKCLLRCPNCSVVGCVSLCVTITQPAQRRRKWRVADSLDSFSVTHNSRDVHRMSNTAAAPHPSQYCRRTFAYDVRNLFHLKRKSSMDTNPNFMQKSYLVVPQHPDLRGTE